MMCGGVIGVHCENRVKEVEIVCAKIQIFWRIHILAKRAHYFVTSVRLTACPRLSVPTVRISTKFYIGVFY
jgi:hypothetical protein